MTCSTPSPAADWASPSSRRSAIIATSFRGLRSESRLSGCTGSCPRAGRAGNVERGTLGVDAGRGGTGDSGSVAISEPTAYVDLSDSDDASAKHRFFAALRMTAARDDGNSRLVRASFEPLRSPAGLKPVPFLPQWRRATWMKKSFMALKGLPRRLKAH